jgi:hypothetical protein
MGWVVNAPVVLPRERPRYPLYRRLGGPHGRSGQVRKISFPPGFKPPDRIARAQSLLPTALSRPTTFKNNKKRLKINKLRNDVSIKSAVVIIPFIQKTKQFRKRSVTARKAAQYLLSLPSPTPELHQVEGNVRVAICVIQTSYAERLVCVRTQ